MVRVGFESRSGAEKIGAKDAKESSCAIFTKAEPLCLNFVCPTVCSISLCAHVPSLSTFAMASGFDQLFDLRTAS